jgi:hypothetical protein
MSKSNLRVAVRLVLLFSLIFALSLTQAWADTIGSSLSTSRNSLDVAQGQVYIYAGGDFASSGETVSTFSWYGPVFSGAQRDLTPLLFLDNGNGSYTVEAIGTSMSVSGSASAQGPVAFGLQSGSLTTGSNWTFGFVNGIVNSGGTVTATSAGDVGFDALEGGTGVSGGSSNNDWVYTPTVSGITTLTVGTTTFGGNGTPLNSSVPAPDRTYSAQANANASGVAEPGTFSLITGAGLVFAGLFRYRYTRGRRS